MGPGQRQRGNLRDRRRRQAVRRRVHRIAQRHRGHHHLPAERLQPDGGNGRERERRRHRCRRHVNLWRGHGTRTRTASAGNSVESDLIVITGDASTDFGTATDADLTWLSAALETSVTAATGRDDGSDDAQTFTTAYTGTNLVEYRTNRTAGSPAAPLDVASLYLIDNGSDDRLVVTGADYGSQSYLSGQATNTLSYGGRITAPQLLAGVGGTAHTATHGFTLDIVVATGGASATFEHRSHIARGKHVHH